MKAWLVARFWHLIFLAQYVRVCQGLIRLCSIRQNSSLNLAQFTPSIYCIIAVPVELSYKQEAEAL